MTQIVNSKRFVLDVYDFMLNVLLLGKLPLDPGFIRLDHSLELGSPHRLQIYLLCGIFLLSLALKSDGRDQWRPKDTAKVGLGPKRNCLSVETAAV